MCAYTRKWRAFQEFRYHSSDRNGDPYTDEYLAHCDDKYKVRAAPHISPFLYLCLLQHECIPYTAKKYIITRSNLFKFAETFKCMRIETHPEEYAHHLPSLCSHITKMINTPPYKYVFSSDFLSRGYRINRMAAEKMWIIICEPETTTMQDVANVVQWFFAQHLLMHMLLYLGTQVSLILYFNSRLPESNREHVNI